MAASKRIAAIDVARGITIIGVVFNHTILGFIAAGLIARHTAIAGFNDALYIFRMPALVLIAGLFIPSGVTRSGPSGYIRRRLTLLLYLYLLWFYIQTPVEIATSSVKNHPKGLETLLSLWWPPAQLWFLPFLALATVLVVWTLQLDSEQRQRLALAVLAAAGVALWSFAPNLVGIRGLALVGFLAVGAAINLRRMGDWLCRSVLFHGAVLIGAALLFGAMFASLPLEPATLDHRVPLELRALSAVAASLGVLALLSVAALLARIEALAQPLATLGARYTLQIYLAHIIVVAGVRIVCTRLGIVNVAVLAPLAVAAGVLVPIALAIAAQRLGTSWIFEPPAWLAPRRQTTATPSGSPPEISSKAADAPVI